MAINNLKTRLFAAFKRPVSVSLQRPSEILEPPCTRWILLRGPAIGSPSHRGTLIVEAKSILSWAQAHAKGVWSSDADRQSARERLPHWIEEAIEEDESVTIPSAELLDVLQPYDEDFIEKATVRLWCPDCRLAHSRVTRGTRDDQLIGKSSLWVSEWRCPEGHLVHSESNEIRWIIR